ncbi:MAG: SCP2 sterol-binding domain-containing protein [Pseudomonadota bacterium]
MITPSKQFLIETLQKALNQYLALDPESHLRLQELQGKQVALELLPFKISFYLRFSAGQAQLSLATLDAPETTIKGTPLRLLMLGLAPRVDRKKFFADDVIMQGNPVLGQQVIDLFDQLHIDWEEFTAKVFGDVTAHHAGNVVRNAREWVNKTQMILTQNLNEYLHEEINVFPPSEALQDFFKEVDALRMDTDRLDARVQVLQKKITDLPGDV